MLLDDIIGYLSDDKHSLTDILLKTKVLLADFDDPHLDAWVTNELNGYPNNSELPGYRILHPSLMGNVVVGYQRYFSHPLPTAHLEKKWIDRLGIMESPVRFGLARIEALCEANDGTGSLMNPLPVECFQMLSKGLLDGNVEKAWAQVERSQMADIPAQIRSRLLDFMLQLRKKVGKGTPDAEVKDKTSGVDVGGLFNSSIFHGQTHIFVSQGNTQVIHQTVSKGDIDGVTSALESIGVPEAELTALKSAIAADTKRLGSPSMEGATGTWYSGLLGKAARGALGVGVDVISSTATKIFFGFMGMPVP